MKYLLSSLFLVCLVGSSAQASTLHPESGAFMAENGLNVQNPTDRSRGGGGSGSLNSESGGSDGDGDNSGHGSGGSGAHSGDRGGSVPMNSPEPITMIALLGGASAAGALSRRRKKKEQI